MTDETTTREITAHDRLRAMGDEIYAHDPYGGGMAAEVTVAELEEIWGSTRDEWPLLGPPADDHEPLAIVRREYYGPKVRYTVERVDEDGQSYVAIDETYTLDDLGEAVFAGSQSPEERAFVRRDIMRELAAAQSLEDLLAAITISERPWSGVRVREDVLGLLQDEEDWSDYVPVFSDDLDQGDGGAEWSVLSWDETRRLVIAADAGTWIARLQDLETLEDVE